MTRVGLKPADWLKPAAVSFSGLLDCALPIPRDRAGSMEQRNSPRRARMAARRPSAVVGGGKLGT